jgi:GT2 family glycosyltransferase
MQTSSIPSVFVIILNFNGKNCLSDCLNSVFKSNYKNFEVVVVDNDSQDGSLEKARQDFSRAHFIKNSANVGFSQGNNAGIRFALEKFADYILVLNNDTIIKNDTLTDLVCAAKTNPDAGILSPLIKDDRGGIWFAGGKVLWKKMRTSHLTKYFSEKPFNSEYLSGCAMFISKAVFGKIGLFDERYFLYYEDADFSLRAAVANFKLLLVPSIEIIHAEQSNFSNKEKIYWLVLSGLIFFHTHTKKMQKIRMHIYLLLRKTKNFFTTLFFSNENARQVRRAYRDYKKIPA